MSTRDKIEINKYYGGDVDRFSHASRSHKQIMSDGDFFLITRIVQDLVVIKNGLASKEFQEKVDKSLQDNCDNQKTISLLKSIV